MKILVCIKQVPDSESAIEINTSGKWIRLDDSMVFRMNRYDEFALEEALLIKESFLNVEIDAISAGPARAESTLRRALSMGADNGIHIIVNGNEYLSPREIASLISSYARDKKYDIIFTGVMAEDDMQSQTGQMIAAMLNLPFATSCIRQSISAGMRKIYADREIEEGLIESLELKMPALLTVQSGINRPRYPSLSNVLRAKKQEILSIKAEDLSGLTANESLHKINYPEKSEKGIFIEGSTEEKAVKLLEILHNNSLI